MTPFMPHEIIVSPTMIGAEAELSDVTFAEFTKTTKCGAKQVAFKLNDDASDYIPRHVFSNTVIRNVENDALIYIMDAPSKWANKDDCGVFTCTGPANVLLDFTNT